VSGIETFPRPLQRPHPPILVGAGSRRMLGIAGREADVVGILPKALPDGTISEELEERSPETLARKVDWVRQAAADRPDGPELSMMVGVVVADDYREVAEQVAIRNGWGAAAGLLVERMPSLLLGPVDRIAEQVERQREQLGFSYLIVSDEHMERFAPVVERLAGR
jgi:alkanesulfonate monooxygenase SsuD/methylene tetrahydromethanopterin reductase-like flavin-dependent oxidoreductase (luciferase family)